MKETVLITSNAYFPNVGGVENSLRYLASSYKELGYQVIVVVSNVAAKGISLPARETIDGITIYRYPTYAEMSAPGKAFRGLRSARAAWKLLKVLNQQHNIVLTLSRFHTSTLLASLARLPNLVYLVPGVVKNQNTAANLVQLTGLGKLKLHVSRFLHHMIQKSAFKRSQQVVVFSNNMVKQVTDVAPSVGLLPVLKPGVDSTRFCPVTDKNSLKAQYHLPRDKMILLTVGRFVRAKGFELVVDAMNKLPQCHLVMIGDGENMANIRQLIADNSISDRITLMGSQNDTAPFYQLADIFLMSSLYEPLGQTILEGLSSALPVVAFHGPEVTTATRELLSEDEAVYNDKVNADGLVECVTKLTSDAELREKLARNSREIAKTRFSWTTLAKQILEYRKAHESVDT